MKIKTFESVKNFMKDLVTNLKKGLITNTKKIKNIK